MENRYMAGNLFFYKATYGKFIRVETKEAELRLFYNIPKGNHIDVKRCIISAHRNNTICT